MKRTMTVLSRTKTLLAAATISLLGLGMHLTVNQVASTECFDCGSRTNCLDGSNVSTGYEVCVLTSGGGCYVAGYTEDCSLDPQ